MTANSGGHLWQGTRHAAHLGGVSPRRRSVGGSGGRDLCLGGRVRAPSRPGERVHGAEPGPGRGLRTARSGLSRTLSGGAGILAHSGRARGWRGLARGDEHSEQGILDEGPDHFPCLVRGSWPTRFDHETTTVLARCAHLFYCNVCGRSSGPAAARYGPCLGRRVVYIMVFCEVNHGSAYSGIPRET